MLTLDYTIKRGMEEFKPYKEWKNIDSNIFMLTAPNGRGKSTFLNVIALGLYGDRELENQRISESIKPKLKNTANRKDQELSFDINMVNSKGISLSLQKPKNKAIKVIEKDGVQEKSLTSDLFEKKYFLIYDIPENPLGKLSMLVSNVASEQSRYNSKLSDLRNYLTDILREIQSQKNPENIEDFRKNIEDAKSNRISLEEKVNKAKNKNDVLSNYRLLKTYESYSKVFDQIQSNLKKHVEEETKADLQKKAFSKHTSKLRESREKSEELDSLLSSVKETMGDFFNSKYKAYPLLNPIIFSESLDTYTLPIELDKALSMVSKDLQECINDPQ